VREDFTDSIKITVIAASFQETIEEEEKRERPPRRGRIQPGEDLDVPTFLRRNRKAESKPEPSD
jgi:hypothetical protein